MTKKKVQPKARKKVRGVGRCWYCGEHVPPDQRTIDHVIPIANGGKSRQTNLVMSCPDCNRRKGDMSLEEYRRDHNNGFPFYGESRF